MHKHVGLLVEPEHYGIVGAYLLKTMLSILGPDVANSEFLDAWRIAYGNLAQILINTEHVVFTTKQNKNGAWRGFKEFVVMETKIECEDVKSVYFAPKDTSNILAKADPGQYICIRWVLRVHWMSAVESTRCCSGHQAINIESLYG